MNSAVARLEWRRNAPRYRWNLPRERPGLAHPGYCAWPDFYGFPLVWKPRPPLSDFAMRVTIGS